MKRTSKKWSPSEIERLKEKGFVPERTIHAVRQMKNRLGLRARREPRPPWSEEDLEKLKRMHENGLSARTIHQTGLLSHSVNAIQKQMCRLGLAKKNKVFKFPPEVRDRFRKFLREHWQGKIPEDLVEDWDRENAKYPTNKRKVISYLTEMGLKIPYGEVQRIKNLRRKIEKVNREGGTSGQILEKIRLERVEMMTKRIEGNKDIWTGLPVELELCEED